ncbi:MAG: rod shape-determining protein MreC [Desulfobulbus propionicus]|nr:MAG: rod shape-determining protein MreC [Desulfobulbus propionicus]
MRKQSTRKRGNNIRIFRILLLSALVLTMALIFLASTLGGQKFGALHKLILETAGPMQESVAAVSTYLHKTGDKYRSLVAVHEENERLHRELEEARGLLHQSREALATNARLRKLLDFKKSIDYPAIACKVVGKDPSLWFRTVVIDRGESDGVVKGSAVLNAEGIVGQVFAVSPSYSRILLAIAPSSAIDVLLQKSRVRGILKGTGTLIYRLEYVLKTVDVAEGDVVVSAGYSGLFPTGLPVGVVSRVIRKRRGMFHEIEVTPAVDYLTLENLLIIDQRVPELGVR